MVSDVRNPLVLVYRREAREEDRRIVEYTLRPSGLLGGWTAIRRVLRYENGVAEGPETDARRVPDQEAESLGGEVLHLDCKLPPPEQVEPRGSCHVLDIRRVSSFATTRYRWWDVPPPEWGELAAIADRIVDLWNRGETLLSDPRNVDR